MSWAAGSAVDDIMVASSSVESELDTLQLPTLSVIVQKEPKGHKGFAYVNHLRHCWVNFYITQSKGLTHTGNVL